MKETAKEGRFHAFFGKALLLFAAAFVTLCINPRTAHAEASLPMGGGEDDDYYIDADGNMTVYSQEGLENWAFDIMGGPDTFKEMVRTVTVNEGVTSIEIQDIYEYAIPSDRAFSGARNLTSVSLPASLEVIGDRAFFNCASLTSVTFVGPSSLTTIGESAFANTALKSITIPDSVTSIGDGAFDHCSDLTSVTMLGETPPTLGNGGGDDNVFRFTGLNTKDKQIYVPQSSIMTYKENWTQWRDYINDGGSAEDTDPPKEEDPDAPSAGSVGSVDPTAEDYADTSIDVQGFTKDATVYSVDVEWGAMTFQYENATWDATEHKTIPGAGWRVYDSVNNKPLDTKTDAINQIQVTNHSNADVWATLAYAGAETYTDTSGSFAIKAGDTVTDYNETGEYLFLATADNGEAGAAGNPTVGTVYFMPSGIKEEYKNADGITKWKQIGTITVGILTEAP